MADTVLTVNGYDLSALNFQVDKISGWRDGLTTQWTTATVPGRYGVIVTSSQPVYKPREITVEGTVVSDSVTTLLTNLEQLKGRIGDAEQTFTLVDDTSLEFYARCTGFQTTGIPPMIIQRASKVSLKLWMADPRMFATSDTVVSGITTSPTDLPLGNVPSWADISVTGSGSFTMTYKDHSGATIYTMTVTGATAPVSIDMLTHTITDAGGNAADHITAGGFFAFDPVDADDPYGTPDWPTLEFTSGTGSATYRKTYR